MMLLLTDIDECATPDVCPQDCSNTQGSFTCQCFSGFFVQDGACVDVNECIVNDDCDPTSEQCRNTIGSYVCDCVSGFVADGQGNCVGECRSDKSARK